MSERHTKGDPNGQGFTRLGRFVTVNTGALTHELVPYVRDDGSAREAEVQEFLARIRARLGPVCDRCGYRQNTAGHRNVCGDAS